MSYTQIWFVTLHLNPKSVFCTKTTAIVEIFISSYESESFDLFLVLILVCEHLFCSQQGIVASVPSFRLKLKRARPYWGLSMFMVIFFSSDNLIWAKHPRTRASTINIKDNWCRGKKSTITRKILNSFSIEGDKSETNTAPFWRVCTTRKGRKGFEINI